MDSDWLVSLYVRPFVDTISPEDPLLLCFFQTNFMGVTESVADDPCKFAIWTTRSPSEIYLLKAETPEDKNKWIKTLQQLLEHLKQFANGKVENCSEIVS